MAQLSSRAKDVPRSGIRVLMDMAQEKPDVIHLELGQPGFPTPEHVLEAAHRAAVQGYTGYTPNAGYLSLREKIASQLIEHTGVPTSADNIVVTAGSMQALYSSIVALVEPGEEVLISDPGYPNYTMMTILAGGIPIYYPLTASRGFRPDIDSLEKLISHRTKVIILNSPSNPTGAVLPVEDIKALLSIAQSNDLFVLSDEAYGRILFEGEHFSPRCFDKQDRVISCYSFSKTYSMTGWRVGYAVASLDIAKVLTKLQEVLVACVSSISQKAAEAALDGPQEIVEEMVEAYRKNRNLAVSILEKAGMLFIRPQGAFYLMLDVGKSKMDSYTFAKELLLATGVVVAPGETFGPSGKRYIRISLAASNENIETGLNRLISFLKKFD